MYNILNITINYIVIFQNKYTSDVLIKCNIKIQKSEIRLLLQVMSKCLEGATINHKLSF